MAASKQGISAANTADREIAATRVFDAPRELVWKTWTQPEHISNWWGPDGADYQNKIVYVEVVKHERIVYDHVSPPVFRVTATFTDLGDKTEISMRMVFESAALREKTAKDFDAVEGLHQTLGRLVAQLASMAEAGDRATSNFGERTIVITREFDAPRELVFNAWTDPKHMAHWWGPRGFTNPVCELDARPGGLICIDMRGPDGTVYPMKGVFHEVFPPERLVFTSSAVFDAWGNPQLEVLNTVTFAEHDGKTKLTLPARVTKVTPEVAGAFAGMKQEWTQSLERLAEFTAKP
jgi:uncharacterized protein YndB with AHSA1/START domain